MFWKVTAVVAVLAAAASSYRLKGLVLSETLTNRAILVDGTIVVFPLCIYSTLTGSEERFPVPARDTGAPAPSGPYRC